jgi:cytochrome b pre-mRNA-processing protein 3
MKKLAGMFYGRLEAYSKAMDVNDAEALAAALRRNIRPVVAEAADMSGLARWMFEVEAYLGAQSEDLIATGSATLPKVA